MLSRLHTVAIAYILFEYTCPVRHAVDTVDRQVQDTFI